MLDVLATGSDRALERRLRGNSLLVQDTAAYLVAFLDPDLPPEGWSGDRARQWRLGILDVELAAETLRRSLPSASDYAVTVGLRAVLAGEVVELQKHVRGLMTGQAHIEERMHVADSLEGTEHVSRTLAAIQDLREAIDRLSAIPRAAEAGAEVQRVAPEQPHAHHGRRWEDPEATAKDRLAVQSGITVGISIFLGGLVSAGAEYWAALPAYRGLASADGSRWTRALARGISAVAGATAAFGLALATDHSPVVAFTLLAISVFLTSFLYSMASSWTTFWQTIVLATVYDTVSSVSAESIGVRILETLIGAFVAVVVAAVVLPTRTRTRLLEQMTVAVKVAMNASHAAFERVASSGPHDSVPDDAEFDTTEAMKAIQARARPLREGPGALQGGGVEGQMTSLWALLYYTQRLSKGAAAGGTPTIRSAQWQAIDAASREAFDAALSALDGHLPARIPDVRDTTLAARMGATPAEVDLLLDVERMNEALAEFIDDVNPGAAAGRPA